MFKKITSENKKIHSHFASDIPTNPIAFVTAIYYIVTLYQFNNFSISISKTDGFKLTILIFILIQEE